MANNESNRIEYKRELTDGLERSVTAFLNYNEGGFIFIGVDDDGNPCGLDDIDELQRKIADRIKNNISPSTLGLFDVVIEKRGGQKIIKIVVSSGTEKPYYIRKYGRSEQGCFLRVGSSVQQMTPRMIDEFYARQRPALLGNIPAPRKDLSFEQLEIYYQAKKLKLNDKFKTSLELLTEDGRDNFVAYLLADENGVSIKVAKYAGKNKVHLIENYEYGYCCLIKAANQVLDRLDVENRIFARITPKARIEKQMVDKTALREAVINAIVHNDYSSNAVPTVEIFSDRITVTSYGGLPEGLSRESFFECCSKPRNRELMRVFRDVNLVEQLGSGMGRILSVYNESVFKFAGDFLIVTLPFDEECMEWLENENSGEVGTNGNDGNEVGTNGTNLGTNNQNIILKTIQNDEKITLNKLAEQTALSRRTISREVKALSEAGILRRIGSTRGHWEIIK